MSEFAEKTGAENMELFWAEKKADSKQTARVSLSNERLLSRVDLCNHSCVISLGLGRLLKVL